MPIPSLFMVRLAAALASLWLLACNGCNDHNAPPPNPAGSAAATAGGAAPQTAGETVVQVEDDGKTFDVAAGATVTFKLASNAGTGYLWMPTGIDPGILAQTGDRTNEAASSAPGAPRVDVYRFAAKRPGSATVEMDLQRPWTKSAPPAKSIHEIVNVH
jgi:predicted secreted protein